MSQDSSRLPPGWSNLLRSTSILYRRLKIKADLVFFLCVISIATQAHAETLFSSTSPWNTSIPISARIGSENVASNLPVGFDTWDPGGYWTVNYYVAKATDRKVAILYNKDAWSAVFSGRWRRQGNTKAVEQEILGSSVRAFPYPGNVFSTISTTDWVLPDSYNQLTQDPTRQARFYVPEGAYPPMGADGHMAVRQPTNGVLETYAAIVISDGTIVALSYSVTNPIGLGDGWQCGQTASMLPSYGGAILDDEITSGIRHAMAITVPPSLLTPSVAYPAYAFDRDALTNPDPYSGTLPMGARLALPRNLNLGDLGLTTDAGQAIASAAQKYGFIIVDRGGEGVTIRVRPTRRPSQKVLHAYDWALQNDLSQIMARVRVVSF